MGALSFLPNLTYPNPIFDKTQVRDYTNTEHNFHSGKGNGMIIAIFAKSIEEYEQLEEWTRQYGNQQEMRFAGRWFRDLVDYNQNANKEEFPICILALEDIENQEVAIKIREWSEWSQFVWIGEDKRFGLSSHRLGTANFIFRPAKAEDIALSLQRCLARMSESSKW